MFSWYITGLSNICFCVQAAKKARICQLKLEQGAAKVAEDLQKCKFFLKAHSPCVSGNSYSITINLISFFKPLQMIRKVTPMPLEIHTKHSLLQNL